MARGKKTNFYAVYLKLRVIAISTRTVCISGVTFYLRSHVFQKSCTQMLTAEFPYYTRTNSYSQAGARVKHTYPETANTLGYCTSHSLSPTARSALNSACASHQVLTFWFLRRPGLLLIGYPGPNTTPLWCLLLFFLRHRQYALCSFKLDEAQQGEGGVWVALNVNGCGRISRSGFRSSDDDSVNICVASTVPAAFTFSWKLAVAGGWRLAAVSSFQG